MINIKKNINLIYGIAILASVLSVCFFYFSYYGLTLNYSNLEIKNELNNDLRHKIETPIGDFYIRRIDDIVILPNNKIESKINMMVDFFYRAKINVTVKLKGDIIFYKESHFLTINNIVITNTDFEDTYNVLSNKSIKAINFQIQKQIAKNLLYNKEIKIAPIFTSKFVQNVTTQDDNLSVVFSIY